MSAQTSFGKYAGDSLISDFPVIRMKTWWQKEKDILLKRKRK